MQNFLRIIYLIVICSYLSACSTKVAADFKMPAKNSRSAAIKNVAVLDFTGELGDRFSSELQVMLTNAELDGMRYFNVANRRNVRSLMNEHGFQMSGLTEDEVIKQGRLIGVNGVYSGMANAYEYHRPYMVTRSRSECETVNKKQVCKTVYDEVSCDRYDYDFNAVVNLTDVETGSIIYSRKFHDSDTENSCSDDTFPYMGNFASFKERAIKTVLNKLRQDIAPYYERKKIIIKEDSKGISDKTDLDWLKKSIKKASDGDLVAACNMWNDLLKKYPNNITIIFNNGICAEIVDNVDKAEKFYRMADSLTPKTDTVIDKAIKRIQYRKAELMKLRSQGAN